MEDARGAVVVAPVAPLLLGFSNDAIYLTVLLLKLFCIIDYVKTTKLPLNEIYIPITFLSNGKNR
jgi:hypothetical protein